MGSFRVLDKLAFGQFDQAVLLDNDLETSKFNTLLPEMFLKPRIRFLEDLVGAQFGPEEVAAIVQGGEAEIAVLTKYATRNTRATIMTVWAYEVWGTDYAGMAEGSRLFFSHLLNFLNRETWPMTCLGNPAAYQRVQEVAKKGGILTAHGNWERKDDMREIGSRIRRSDSPQVSAVDLSNSHNYFRRPNWELQAALRQLPLHPDARLLMTRQEDDTTDGWRYFSMPVSNALGDRGEDIFNAVISLDPIEEIQAIAPVQNLNLLQREPILQECRRLLLPKA